jgi:hypothetical protein
MDRAPSLHERGAERTALQPDEVLVASTGPEGDGVVVRAEREVPRRMIRAKTRTEYAVLYALTALTDSLCFVAARGAR